ncbi:MAG: GNAT family N-acetyltransferase, partial [Rhodopila sp.]
PGKVELAVSVRAGHRRRGLGRSLVGATVAAAFRRGAEVAEFLFAPDNRAVVALIRALDAHIESRGLGHAAWRRQPS